MGAPTRGPCAVWTDPEHVGVCSPCRADTFDDELITEAIAAASETLYVLSGRQFPGECSDTVRPCRAGPATPTWWPTDVVFDGVLWLGACSCGASEWDSCGCPARPRISLPGRPVVDVDEVKLDGAVFTDYRVDDYRWLVRTDGDDWPCCQNLLADPDTDDDTFEISYTFGVEPPTMGKVAAARLACEIYRLCSGGECSLPRRVQTITREGVTMAMLDPFDFLDNGKTGLYEVDLFLKAHNPAGRRRSAAIYSPDVGPTSTRVDTGG